MRIHNSVIIVFLIGILMISPFIDINPLITIAAQVDSPSTSSAPSSVSNSTSSNTTSLGNSANSNISDAKKKMVDISTSDKPEDIATLAYIWGYPLITMQRSFDYFTSPDTQAKGIVGAGPSNDIHFARELVNASFKDVVSPNEDTLYGQLWADLTREPLVLKVPPIESDRYYSFEFLDA
jgi:hypothetical protein